MLTNEDREMIKDIYDIYDLVEILDVSIEEFIDAFDYKISENETIQERIST